MILKIFEGIADDKQKTNKYTPDNKFIFNDFGSFSKS